MKHDRRHHEYAAAARRAEGAQARGASKHSLTESLSKASRSWREGQDVHDIHVLRAGASSCISI
jgi:hypothetical protein